MNNSHAGVSNQKIQSLEREVQGLEIQAQTAEVFKREANRKLYTRRQQEKQKALEKTKEKADKKKATIEKFKEIQTQRKDAVRTMGEYKNRRYEWATNGDGKDSSVKVVNGWISGNELRNVNAAKIGNSEIAPKNNVHAILFGKNIWFYFVGSKPIKASDELFIDYGPYYTLEPPIKQEAQEQALKSTRGDL